jgi:phosphate/sulfate permease
LLSIVQVDIPPVLGFDKLKPLTIILISILLALGAAVVCQLLVVPLMKRRVESTATAKLSKSANGASSETVITTVDASTSINDTDERSEVQGEKELEVQQSTTDASRAEEDETKVNKLFHSLQTLTAMFTSFAHGGNDVRYNSNNQRKKNSYLNFLRMNISATQLDH